MHVTCVRVASVIFYCACWLTWTLLMYIYSVNIRIETASLKYELQDHIQWVSGRIMVSSSSLGRAWMLSSFSRPEATLINCFHVDASQSRAWLSFFIFWSLFLTGDGGGGIYRKSEKEREKGREIIRHLPSSAIICYLREGSQLLKLGVISLNYISKMLVTGR